jgi:hypothetical protein
MCDEAAGIGADPAFPISSDQRATWVFRLFYMAQSTGRWSEEADPSQRHRTGSVAAIGYDRSGCGPPTRNVLRSIEAKGSKRGFLCYIGKRRGDDLRHIARREPPASGQRFRSSPMSAVSLCRWHLQDGAREFGLTQTLV